VAGGLSARKTQTLDFQIDPEFRDLLPPLEAHELELLTASIRRDGCRDPLVVWDGLLIDGHHRHAICTAHGIDYTTRAIAFDSREEAIIWIIETQAGRRNLPLWQRCELALVVEKNEAVLAKRRQAEAGPKEGRGKKPTASGNISGSGRGDARDKAAPIANTTGRTLSKVKAVLAHGDEKIIADARAGELSVSKAYTLATEPERRKKRIDKIIAASTAGDGPDCSTIYPLILADPPWQYEHDVYKSRSLENQYPTMTLDAICDLTVPAAPSCALFLWAPSSILEQAFRVINAWNFSYRTCFVWVKDKIGMGYFARQRHELLLFAIRGDIPAPPTKDRADSVIEAPRLRHSQKPDVVYDIIERMYPDLPKVELFARASRDGWARWGHEA